VNDVQLNMARNDLATKDAKRAACYPEQATQSKIKTLRDEANAYANAKRVEQREANSNFATKQNAITKLADSARELYMRLYEKEKELISLTNKRENLEQYERRERRAFLDNVPQEGTGGIPGVRTTDDRVLLTFWITYGAALILGTLFILNIYGAQLGATDTKSNVQIIVAVLLIAYGVAYGFITYYG
jgi:glutaredoxin-related protein